MFWLTDNFWRGFCSVFTLFPETRPKLTKKGYYKKLNQKVEEIRKYENSH